MPAHSNKILTSDSMLVVSMVLGAIGELFVPSSIPQSVFARYVIGGLIVFSGWSLILTAKRQFVAHCMRSGPGHETNTLLTTGVYSVTRNPIYLGVSFLPVGFGFLFGSWWLVGSSALTATLIHHLLIIPEERYLRDKFGKQYATYCAKVRRWI